MRSVEYKEINGRLDQERRVLLSRGVFNRSLQALAYFDSTDPANVKETKRYASADHEIIHGKLRAEFPKNGVEHSFLKVALSVDEQKYITYALKSLADSHFSRGELKLCRDVYMDRGKFQSRCWIANRQTRYPSNLLWFGPKIINFPKPQDAK